MNHYIFWHCSLYIFLIGTFKKTRFWNNNNKNNNNNMKACILSLSQISKISQTALTWEAKVMAAAETNWKHKIPPDRGDLKNILRNNTSHVEGQNAKPRGFQVTLIHT